MLKYSHLIYPVRTTQKKLIPSLSFDSVLRKKSISICGSILIGVNSSEFAFKGRLESWKKKPLELYQQIIVHIFLSIRLRRDEKEQISEIGDGKLFLEEF